MKEILCFGDSNTYGLIPGTTRRYDREARWTGILAEKLYDKGYRIIEEGLCGRTSVFDDATRDGRNGAKVLPIPSTSTKPKKFSTRIITGWKKSRKELSNTLPYTRSAAT